MSRQFKLLLNTNTVKSQPPQIYQSMFCLINIDLPPPKHGLYHPPESLVAKNHAVRLKREEKANGNSKKRKIRADNLAKDAYDAVYGVERRNVQERNYRMIVNYSNVAYLDFVGEKEMVVVEGGWDLGDVVRRDTYGS